MSINLPSGFEDPDGTWARYLAARGDLRIEIVKRAIDRGALAGYSDATVTDYAAWLVIDALDSFDADVEHRAYEQGFRQGVAFGRFRHGNPPV